MSVSFFAQYEQNDESHVTSDDIERIVSLPVDESLRIYIGLRNFNDKYPAYMNVVCMSPTKSMVVSGDGRTWVPEFTNRCANVVLDCYLTRLNALARVKPVTEWNSNVAKMVVDLDNSKRKKYARMVAVIMRFLSDCKRHKITVSDATNDERRNALENFLWSDRVELSGDARCPFMEFLAAFKRYIREYNVDGDNFRMDRQFFRGPLERRNVRITDVVTHRGVTETFVVGIRLVPWTASLEF